MRIRIERERIGGLIKILRDRDDRQRGMQPLMALGCFYDLNVEDGSFCISCWNYKTCELYLKTFEKKEALFGRE